MGQQMTWLDIQLPYPSFLIPSFDAVDKAIAFYILAKVENSCLDGRP